MTVDSLEELLEQLQRGDDAAAEQVFRDYEPYLRKVVRRMLPAHLRSKFDSVDIVQSVWGDVFTAFRDRGMRFASVPQFQAFLVRATRNRFVDRVRTYRTAADRERSTIADLDLMTASNRPRPSEEAVASELWARLLKLCPEEHRSVLEMRRDGTSSNEIADRVGLHVGSVRRILRELAVRLACEAP